MPTISDSSPIIALHAIGRLQLLRDVFDAVIVPLAVAAEVMRFPLPTWIQVMPVPPSAPNFGQHAGLGPGESEVIRLALHFRPDRVLLDDADARNVAKGLGLLVVGVVGVLLAAKDLGVIPEIAGDLDRLLATTFRISSRLYRNTLTRAGEL